MNKGNIKLTSVKLIKGLYDEFKLKTVNSEMTLQKETFTLVRRLENALRDSNTSKRICNGNIT